jgi:hypothetical protein
MNYLNKAKNFVSSKLTTFEKIEDEEYDKLCKDYKDMNSNLTKTLETLKKLVDSFHCKYSF